MDFAYDEHDDVDIDENYVGSLCGEATKEQVFKDQAGWSDESRPSMHDGVFPSQNLSCTYPDLSYTNFLTNS